MIKFHLLHPRDPIQEIFIRRPLSESRCRPIETTDFIDSNRFINATWELMGILMEDLDGCFK